MTYDTRLSWHARRKVSFYLKDVEGELVKASNRGRVSNNYTRLLRVACCNISFRIVKDRPR